MPSKPLPSPDVLYAIFDYDPERGRLTWRSRSGASSQWNGRYARRRAGHVAGGRWRVHVPGHGLFSVSRIIWKMVHGEEPQVVDHIDGNSRNDRLANLRAATFAQNAHNTRSRSRSGFKGVSWVRRRNRFEARIHLNGRTVSLGFFTDPAAAHAAYVAAAQKHFGEFARTK